MTRDPKNVDQPALWGAADALRAQPAAGGPADGRRTGPSARRTPPLLPSQRPTQPMELRELWDITDVANYLGVPKQTIYSWRTTGYGPQGFRVGKHLRWRATTVITWTLGLEQDQQST